MSGMAGVGLRFVNTFCIFHLCRCWSGRNDGVAGGRWIGWKGAAKHLGVWHSMDDCSCSACLQFFGLAAESATRPCSRRVKEGVAMASKTADPMFWFATRKTPYDMKTSRSIPKPGPSKNTSFLPGDSCTHQHPFSGVAGNVSYQTRPRIQPICAMLIL